MDLAPRLTLAMGACAIALIGGSGVFLLQREQRELRSVAVSETLLLGGSLQVAFANAWRDRQVEDVAESLEALTQLDPGLAIYVFDNTQRLLAASRGAQPSAETLHMLQRLHDAPEASSQLAFSPEPVAQLLRLGLPLRKANVVGAEALILEKPLHELNRDLAATQRSIWGVTCVFVGLVAGVTWFLVRRYVELPLARMVTTMQHYRLGAPYTAEKPLSRRDAVGATQQAFHALLNDLAASQQHAEHEASVRQRLEARLQHADKLIHLGHLAAIMAHEIGSPLQILLGRAQLLEQQADDAKRTRRTARMLIEQTERLSRIVAKLLSTTPSRHGPSQAARQWIDAAAAMQSVAALLEVEARTRQVQICWRQQGDCRIFADADSLQQLALNILRNALDAAPAHSTIHIACQADTQHFYCSVNDAGKGIPSALQEQVFQPFFTTKALGKGSGLGLSIVRSIVQAYGGKIQLRQAQPQGCAVCLTLPRHQADARLLNA